MLSTVPPLYHPQVRAILLAIVHYVGCLAHSRFQPWMLMFFDMVFDHGNHHVHCMNDYLIQMGSQRHAHDEFFHHGPFCNINLSNGEHDTDFGQVCNHNSDDNQKEVLRNR